MTPLRYARRWLAATFPLLASCSNTPSSTPSAPSTGADAPRQTDASDARVAQEPRTPAAEDVPDGGVEVFENGQRVRVAMREQAEAEGFTVVDLRDDWTPAIFQGPPDDVPSYRATWLALAAERTPSKDAAAGAFGNAYLELYGVFPTLHVVGARLVDDPRHRCHDAVDDAPLGALKRLLVATDEGVARGKKGAIARLEQQLAKERNRRQKAGNTDPSAMEVALGRDLEARRELAVAVHAVQEHLKCDGMLDKRAEAGVFDGPTAEALKTWQRRHVIISWGHVTPETRDALLTDSRELDFRAVLRALRERVADAAGLVEDGTAQGAFHDVAGRNIDPPEFRAAARSKALADGAPDSLNTATDAAARALGWTSPEAARAWFDAHKKGFFPVAVRLPARPSYHSAHMELRAEIDRGDVYYDFPYSPEGKRVAQPVHRRPSLVLYARDGERDIPLVRWSTTIGGWQNERAEVEDSESEPAAAPAPAGGVEAQAGAPPPPAAGAPDAQPEPVLRYKESDVGDRVWRDLIAAPAWLPPESTPERELVRNAGRNKWDIKRDLIGPHFRSAYGLVMLIHSVVSEDGPQTRYLDRGIRVHGSVSYRSILTGQSHGCHRLFNPLALRLSSFLLHHHDHVRAGTMKTTYAHAFEWRGHKMKIAVDERGYRYELTPPVAVRVLEGTIRGRNKHAISAPMTVPKPSPPPTATLTSTARPVP